MEYPKNYRVFVKEGLGTLRAEMIDGNAWFYGVDICKILDLPKMCRLVSTGTIKEGDYVLVERLTKSGRRKIYLINASGVNALLDTRRAWKDENKVATFLKWFCDEVALTLHDYKLDVDASSIKLKEDDKVVKEFPEKEESNRHNSRSAEKEDNCAGSGAGSKRSNRKRCQTEQYDSE